MSRSLIFFKPFKVIPVGNYVWKLYLKLRLKARNRIPCLLGRLSETDSGLCQINRPGTVPAFWKPFLCCAFQHSLLVTNWLLETGTIISHQCWMEMCMKNVPADPIHSCGLSQGSDLARSIGSLICFGFNPKLFSLIWYFQGLCTLEWLGLNK